MDVLTWALFAACNVACGAIGWIVGGFVAEYNAHRARRTVRVAPRLVRPPRPCALYHIPGPSYRPLRIGITVNPGAREDQYAREAWWWPQRTGRLTVRRWYPDEATARVAERLAIRREAPIYNIQHNEGRGHVLAARRVGLRHVPDAHTEPDPPVAGAARAQLRRLVDGRRV